MVVSKPALRTAVRASRHADVLAREDRRRLEHFLMWLPKTPGVIATYVSVAGEPGTIALIDELVARGWEVRLPVLRRQPDWAPFDGWDQMREGWQSIPEPTTAPLGAASLADADVVIASCLLVDRDGYRLGVGGGWYDRALLHRRDDAVVLAWARDAEVVNEVPRESFDVPCDGWATESGVSTVA